MLTLYPDCRPTGFAKATKTSEAEGILEAINLKRSLPVLKWSSESEKFEILFADTADTKSNHTTPAAHVCAR